MKKIFLGFIALTFSLVFFTKNESDLHIAARSDIEKILVDTRFNETLSPIWNGAAQHLQGAFDLPQTRVNLPYKREAINIYFFDTRQLGDLSVAGKAARGNFVSIHPNIIFADEEFVKLFIDEYHFYRGSLLQIWEQGDKFTEGDIRRTLIGSAMLRYGNIDNFMTDPYSSEFPLYSDMMITDFNRYADYNTFEDYKEDEIKVIATDPLLSGLVHFLDVMRKERNGDPLPQNFEDIISEHAAQAISFPLLHEIGHLKENSDGGFFDADISQSISLEYEADAYAIAALSGAQKSDWAIGAEFSATLLQQIVFARALEIDFMDAQKLGHFILYNEDDCRSSVRGFFDFNLIADILPTTLPLHTDEEYNLLQKRLMEFRSSSHGFLLDRGTVIEKLATSSNLSFKNDVYTAYKSLRRDFLTGVVSDDLESLAVTQRNNFNDIFGPVSGVPNLEFDFSPFTNEQRQTPAWCLFDDCTVISDDELSVRFEEMRDDTGIVFARLMIRDLFPRNKLLSDRIKNDPNLEKTYNDRVSILLHFLDKTSTISYDDLLSLMLKLDNCGFVSFERDEGTHRVRMSTIGNWSEIQVEVIAKQ